MCCKLCFFVILIDFVCVLWNVCAVQCVFSSISSGHGQRYISLLLSDSNLEKNKFGLLKAISYQDWYDNKTPFDKAFEKGVEWLKIYFNICDKIDYKELAQYKMIQALKQCLRKNESNNHDAEKENQEKQQMLSILKENFTKLFPNDVYIIQGI